MHEALSQESVWLKRICFASTHKVVPEEQEIKAQVLKAQADIFIGQPECQFRDEGTEVKKRVRDRFTDTVQVNGGVGTVAESLVANARLNLKNKNNNM